MHEGTHTDTAGDAGTVNENEDKIEVMDDKATRGRETTAPDRRFAESCTQSQQEMQVDGDEVARPRMRGEAGVEAGSWEMARNDGKCMGARTQALQAMWEQRFGAEVQANQ